MENIKGTYSYHTGGGCMVDIIELKNGLIVAISDEYLGLYKSLDDMLEDDGTKSINGFWLHTNEATKWRQSD